MKAHNSTLKRGKPLKNNRARITSRGMKGASVTAEQKRYHGDLAGLGCIACQADGNDSPFVSIHHIDGRTKPDAHWLVLPLCAGHHQDGTGVLGLTAVHPYKARFEQHYGTQLHLLEVCHSVLRNSGYDVPEAAVEALGNAVGVKL